MTHATKAFPLIGVLIFATAALTLTSSARAQCTTTTIEGTYGFRTDGFLPPGKGSKPVGSDSPAAAIGTITFAADGTLTGTQTANIADQLVTFSFSGTFTINPDCSGVITRGDIPGWDFVAVGNGEEIYFVYVAEAIAQGVMRRTGS